MEAFIALVFTIWFVWYLLKVITQGTRSHSSKIDSRSSKVDYRDHGPYGTRKRETEKNGVGKNSYRKREKESQRKTKTAS